MMDMIKKGTRHFATYNRQTVLILGFNAPSNTVYLVNPAMMPGDEATELLALATGPTAQAADTLAVMLQSVTHGKSGQPWLAHLWANRAWMGTTFPDNLSDMDQNQKNFFKGFGVSLNPETAKPEETHHVVRTTQNQPLVESAGSNEPPIALVDLGAVDDDEQGDMDAGDDGDTELAGKMDLLIQAVTVLAKNIKENTQEVNRVLKRVPKSPGRPPKNDPKKPRIVTGRPTPDAVFSAPQISQTA